MQVFVLGWHFVLTRHKNERDEILVVISLFKEKKRKGRKYIYILDYDIRRDAYSHSHFVQESKEEREEKYYEWDKHIAGT